MITVLVVALGSALGGVARYLLGLLLQRPGLGFPVGTLVVNVLGCFAIGVILRLGLAPDAMTPTTRAFLTAGVCGGFTTFSTFSVETLALFETGAYGRGIAYVMASVVLSVSAAALGYGLGRG